MSKITQEKKKKRQAEHLKKMREIHGPNYGKAQCRSCYRMYEEKDMVVGPDPFASEIYNDNTVVTQCKNCCHDSFMSI